MNNLESNYLIDKLSGKLEKYSYIAEQQLRGVTTKFDPPIRRKLVGSYIGNLNNCSDETFEEYKIRKINEQD